MGKDIYKLQIPIPTELAEQLKCLANHDERSLRSYCKRLIQQHVDDNKNILQSMNNTSIQDEPIISNNENSTYEQEYENEIEPVKKKPKVGALIKPTK